MPRRLPISGRHLFSDSDIEDESRKYLYEYSYQKEEEYGDGKGTEESRFLFMSGKDLQSVDEVESELEKMMNNQENDLVIVFSDFKGLR